MSHTKSRTPCSPRRCTGIRGQPCPVLDISETGSPQRSGVLGPARVWPVKQMREREICQSFRAAKPTSRAGSLAPPSPQPNQHCRLTVVDTHFRRNGSPQRSGVLGSARVWPVKQMREREICPSFRAAKPRSRVGSLASPSPAAESTLPPDGRGDPFFGIFLMMLKCFSRWHQCSFRARASDTIVCSLSRRSVAAIISGSR